MDIEQELERIYKACWEPENERDPLVCATDQIDMLEKLCRQLAARSGASPKYSLHIQGSVSDVHVADGQDIRLDL